MNNVTILELAAVLQYLIPIAAVPVTIFCLSKIGNDLSGDEAPIYKRKLKNAWIFVAISQVAITFFRILYGYFS